MQKSIKFDIVIQNSRQGDGMKKLAVGIALILLVVIIAWWLNPMLRYNIHTVVKGKVYRSAELPQQVLQQIINQYKIKSIINLRNAHPKEQWYIKEVAIAQQNQITLYDLSLPAFHKPTREQLITLTNTLVKAKRPILIHCRHGADRTGLAAAIILILRNQTASKTIEKQVSWHYRAINPNSVGKVVLPFYFKWLQCHGLISSPKNFYNWLYSKYFLNSKKICKSYRQPIAISFA